MRKRRKDVKDDLMNMEKEIKALMERAETWLNGKEKDVSLELTLCKTDQSDTFRVKYDEDKAWALTLMLESDDMLCEAAYSAMLKRFAEMEDIEMDGYIHEFASLCREVHEHMKAVLAKGQNGGKKRIFS